MAIVITKTQYGIGFALLVALVLFLGWKYWGWFGGAGASEKKEGDACIDTNGNPSVIENGVCKEIVRPGPGEGGNGGNGVNSATRKL